MSNPRRRDPFRRTGSEEQNYLLKRAEDHRRLADNSSEASARALHLRFQQLYQAKAARALMVGKD